MKRTVILLALSLTALTIDSQAQVIVDGENLNERKDIEYIQMVAQAKLLSTKVIITIDYGQPKREDSRVFDPETNKPRNFASVIEALNYLNSNGWEYLDQSVYTVGNQNVAHFLFRKKEQGT